MQCFRILITLVSIACLLHDSEGQQISYLNVNDGLSSRYTYGVEQDLDGFIWFATNEGIDRYDGSEFRNYKLNSSPLNPTQLGYRFNILTDSSNAIMAYTTSGMIFRYNEYQDSFEEIFNLKSEVAGENVYPYVKKIYQDRSGIIWFGTTVGTYRLDQSDADLKWLSHLGRSPSHCFADLLQGDIAIGTDDGIRLYNSIHSENDMDDFLFQVTKGMQISSLFYDDELKKLWIGTDNNGPSVYDFNNDKLIDLSDLTPHIPIRSIVKDQQGNILIGLDGAGIVRVDEKSHQIKNTWTSTEDLSDGISDNSVLDIYCDGQDRIWVSTWSAGISIIDKNKPKLEFFEHQFNNVNSVQSSQLNSIHADVNGNLWFGTNSGVSVVDISTNKWNHLDDLKTNNISGYKILAIGEDNKERIWIGGYGNGLHAYNKRTKKITDFTSNSGINYIYSIHYDRNGYMWFGGMEGLLTRMDLKNDSFENYGLKNVTVIIERNQDQIWVGSTSGVYLVEKQSKNVYPYYELVPELAPISNIYVNCLFQDDEGKLWIGTNGGGLNIFDYANKTIKVVSSQDGLPSNFIYGIFSDKKRRIWLSTEKGIGCVDPVSFTSIHLGKIENFSDFPFNPRAHAKTKSGDIVLGGLNGAVKFTPEIIQPFVTNPKLVLNEFRVSYQRVLPAHPDSPLLKPIDQTSEIQLGYDQNSFSFRFSSINFNNTERFNYQWKLEGFEDDWTPPTNSKTAGYTNIPPGQYTFRIRSSLRSKLAFENERQIAINISPPFWKTNLAYVSYLIVLLGLIWLIYSLEQNRLHEKHAADKINFFINTAHDIKTPLSLIKAPLRDLETDKGITNQGLYYLHLAQSNVDKLFRAVTQILDFEKVDSRKSQLVLSKNDLKSYMMDKIISYQLVAEENEISFNFKIPKNEVFVMFDAGKMDKIIDNLFSNAIKYTPPKGSIELIVEVTKKEWFIELSDTGIGIPKKDRKNLFKMYYRAQNAINSRQAGTGIGLVLIQNLVTMHGGKVYLNSQENMGSKFILRFPIKDETSNENLGDSQFASKTKKPTIPELYVNKQVEVFEIPQIGKSRLRVLVVEDDIELRNYLVSSLKKQFHVSYTGDGQSALDLINGNKFDLILSDVMIPNLTGDKLCESIKGNIDTSHIPIILLTGLSEKEDTLKGLKAGADSYITKPFDIDIIHAKIDNILKNRLLVQESLLRGINPESEKVTINNLDKKFIQEVLEIVESELSNPSFSITHLCRETMLSRTILYNKIKAHTGLAPNEFIRTVRMNKAMDLLKSGQHAISVIAFTVGFHDSKYFSTAFKKFFGKSPKHYLDMTNRNERFSS